MSTQTAEKLLKWLLILMGIVGVSAIVPMVMPTDWMEAVNDELGLGPFSRSPLTEYLTRSISALYAMFGALLLYLGLHVRRYLGFIVVFAWLRIGLGVAVTVLDFSLGMPTSWSWGEGPPMVVAGGLILWLARRVE